MLKSRFEQAIGKVSMQDGMIIISIIAATYTGYHLTKKNLKTLKKIHGRKKAKKYTILYYGINLLT